MLKTMHLWILSAAAAGVLIFSATAAGAAPPGALGSSVKALSSANGPVLARHRRYRDWDDDDDDGEYYEVPGDAYFDDYGGPAEYYAPPRVYRHATPPPVDYEPPVYGWLAPPRPLSCGKYRYWNGDHCADARRHRPYVGPKW
jgi:hypothetical protein